MIFKNPMIAVKDIDAAVKFYQDILGLQIISDFGANKILTGGISLQSEETYQQFILNHDINYGSHSFELYFEEDDFDSFIKKLDDHPIRYVHPLYEHSWGQRVIRFYDLDHHIIEVGENIKSVMKRFLNEGMNEEEIAKRMDVPFHFVKGFHLTDNNLSLNYYDLIHTTLQGEKRIKKNLGIDQNVVEYCLSLLQNPNCKMSRNGKNWYCIVNDIQLTINASNYCIITAHKLKGNH